MDRDALIAVIVLWHWNNTPSPEVPKWCKEHALWPGNNRVNGDARTSPAENLAWPQIQQWQKELGLS